MGSNPHVVNKGEEIMIEELFTLLKQFIKEHAWYSNENIPQQARAIFFTICEVGGIEADTCAAENMLLELYCGSQLANLMEYEDFENFMYEYMV